MSYLLPHLKHAYAVDQAIVNEQERVVVVRFGQDANSTCMVVDKKRCIPYRKMLNYLLLSMSLIIKLFLISMKCMN